MTPKPEPSVSPADTPDYEAIRLRAQSQLSHFATSSGSGITGVPSCDRCGKPRNRWDEPCEYLPYAAAHLLAEDVLTLLAVGERDKAELEQAEKKAAELRQALVVQERQWISASQAVGAEQKRYGARIAQLTEALEAFADPKHWAVTRDNGEPVPIWIGTYRQHPSEIARAVLADEEDAHG